MILRSSILLLLLSVASQAASLVIRDVKNQQIAVTPSGLSISDAGVVSGISLTTAITGTLPVANGGTALTSYAIGDIIYASGATTLSKLADVATGNSLISGGVTTAPSWGKIGLTTHVSGTLPVANGGTNASSASITAFNNITGYTASGATGTTSTNLVFSASPTGTGTWALPIIQGTSLALGGATIGTNALAVTGTETITSADASAFAIGRLGATTPAFRVDASTGTSITGIDIKSAASGGGVDLRAIGESGVNLRIDAAGAGTLTLNGTATGTVNIPNTLTGGPGAAGATWILASNLSGATDPTITFGNNSIVFNGLTFSSGEITSTGTFKLYPASSTTTFINIAANAFTGVYVGNTLWAFNNGGDLRVVSGAVIGMVSSATNATGTPDVAYSRIAAGVSAVGTGAAASRAGWQQWAGEAYLAADGTNATATMATTGLSVTVTSGRKYGFKMILYVSNSLAADGVKIDFDGGSAAATNFRAHTTVFDTALLISSQTTAIATDVAAATATGASMIETHGSFEPSGNGTFIPRYSGNTAVSGTVTLARGSHLLMWDMP